MKTGRPRLARGEATHRVVVLLSDSQLANIQQAASDAGETLSAYIREAAMRRTADRVTMTPCK